MLTVMMLLAWFTTQPVYAGDTGQHSHLSGLSQAEETPEEPSEEFHHVTVNYYGIFYGPSLGSPSAFQPNERGDFNDNRPINLKNYLTLGYGFNPEVELSVTAYTSVAPVSGQNATLHDPYLRFALNSIAHSDNFNLYGDVRLHLPVSAESKDADLKSGLQFFQISTFTFPNSKFTLGMYTSERVNFYGPNGSGTDMDLYLGPNISYQVSSSVALTALYEMGASHPYSDETWGMVNDGTDFEPGVSWDVTPNMNVNPYLNFYTGNRVTLQSTSFGMTLSWKML